eukprot:3911537-Pyramimonas_sp.AAC.1
MTRSLPPIPLRHPQPAGLAVAAVPRKGMVIQALRAGAATVQRAQAAPAAQNSRDRVAVETMGPN